jgi:hypothetical protein
MNLSIETFKGFATVTNHRARKSGQGFRRNLDRTRNKKLIVRDHAAKVERPTRLRKATAWPASNVQHRMQKFRGRRANPKPRYFFLSMKLMSPLRST